ncbi:hypothetical protein C7H62_0539 [Mesoflavibacter sp. HG96]|uniref:Uncharacterized protein n=1 Tax=Mesoflavibacter profundi TaxID=2708110 RepID=A0ABT4S0T8_9FLAO|nr:MULTISPECIES: hypothetical protein [Mesoflavibacter]MDA0177396.1 hypothetical protein [Mesoflavibacter profundi]QIJ88348.1 hypothetical protein C7H62_0539 [Mesoflavibacter sp. HG96]QIJ91076.1 hypothetical protein C7H56_0539 [Mesoflavibacter sp. HG37]
MNNIKIFILFIIFSQVSFGQNNSGDFKNYEESQKWITEIKELNAEERKNKIINRVKCEQESEQSEIDFWLTIVIDGGAFSIANDFSDKQIENLKLIPAENFNITQSLCESDEIYPQRCNLGFVLINRPDKPVLNEITELKNIEIKRRKGKIVVKLKSEIEKNIEFELNHLLQGHSTKLLVKKELKKGKNRFLFRRSNNLQLVEAKVNGKKLIIII